MCVFRGMWQRGPSGVNTVSMTEQESRDSYSVNLGLGGMGDSNLACFTQ